MQQLCLKRGEDRRLRTGHLWIFSNEVDVKRTPLTAFSAGEAALVVDSGGRPIGTAYVNPASLISARLVSRQSDCPLNAALLRRRLETALALRERLFPHPYYRLCHSEGDFLPGLTIDRYGDHLAVQISTAGMEAHKDALVEVLTSLLTPASITLCNTTAVRQLENLPSYTETVLGTAPDQVTVPENGALFTVSYLEGQKTGWFYDQRVNRAEAARYASGVDMLDAFCYAGGFGVMAALGGARSVTFLDASGPALALAEANAATALSAPTSGTLGTAGCAVRSIQGDALEVLQELKDSGKRFGLVSIDPPAFIKRRKDAEQGLQAYRRVNELGLDLLEDGGVLVSSSCSHHLEAEILRRVITQSAAKRRLHGQILYQGTQGPDHPIHTAMPESAYLKCVIGRFWK